MSKEKKHALSKAEGLIPELRFPEFVNTGNWKEKKLSQVANYANGKAHEKNISENGQYVVVNSKYISSEGETVKHSDKAFCLAEKGDTLMVLSDVPNGKAIAKCLYVNEENRFTVNQRVCKISSFDCDSNLLYYIMNRNPYFLAFDDGVKQTNLRNVDVQEFIFLLPESPIEQQKIASCLSSLDELIAAHNEKLQALKDHKKGLMQNLFPQDGQKVPKYRFPEFEGDGEWELKNVESFFDVGSSKRVLQKDWTNEGVPFYRTRELVSLSKNEPFGSEIYISENLYEELKVQYGVPAEGDFLVSGVGTLGISYQVKVGDKFYFKDGNVLWFKLEEDLISSYFKYCFESEHIQKQIVGQTSKSTVGTYTITNAKKTEFWYIQNPKEQQKIASCLSVVDNLITAQAEKIEQLQQHKKGLMQGLFPGRLTLRGRARENHVCKNRITL